MARPPRRRSYQPGATPRKNRQINAVAGQRYSQLWLFVFPAAERGANFSSCPNAGWIESCAKIAFMMMKTHYSNPRTRKPLWLLPGRADHGSEFKRAEGFNKRAGASASMNLPRQKTSL
jgi:hypothetical protein